MLCVAKPSRAPIKEDTRCRGFELQRKNGSGIRFDEIETEIGTCFLIHLVVSVPLYVSSFTQIDSKSKMAKFLNNFWSSLYGITKESNFQTGFLLTGIHYLDKCAWFARYIKSNVAPNFQSLERLCHMCCSGKIWRRSSCRWRNNYDCCIVKVWRSFQTFDFFFMLFPQSALHPKSQCRKEKYWVATSPPLSEYPSCEHPGTLLDLRPHKCSGKF